MRSKPPSCTTHHTSKNPVRRSSLVGNASRPTHRSTAFSAAVHSHTVSTSVFDLEKAKVVLESIKADHMKYTPKIPFALPKTYPGFLLILERSSDKVD